MIHNTVITVGENKVEQSQAAVSAHVHMFESRATMCDGWRSSPASSRLIALTYRYFFRVRGFLKIFLEFF